MGVLSRCSFVQVKKDEVGLHLHKAHPGSWAAQLSSVGIEHYQPAT